MNRILLIVGGVLVGVLAALFIVPVFVDWTRYRGTFEEEATRLLGRDVRVSGRVNLRLLPTPYLRFEKVRIADTRGSIGEPIFRADDLTIWLSFGPLFSGAFEASAIEIKKPVVALVLDDKGSGNWADFATARASSVFVPARVALNAVRITNGTIAVYGPGGEERTRIERINGELAAASLEGPYRVTAAFAARGAPRELRLSTARREADGSVRFKGTVRAPDTGASYSLDGQARDLLEQVRIEGELTARLPLPSQQAGATAGFDVRSALKADTAGIEFSDIALSFEQDGRPQLASGSARIAWRQRTDVTFVLNSKWLDLDRIAGNDGTASPLALMARLARSIGAGLPADGQTTARLELEQATLAGEIVSGLAATIERQGSTLALKSLTAALPGGSRIEASGVLAADSPDAAFDGDLVLRGASLARLLAWAGKGSDLPAIGQEGSFALTGRIRVGAEAFSGRGLVLQHAGNSLAGEASWTGGANRRLVLALEGTELDVTPLVGVQARALPSLRALAERLAAVPTQGAAGAPVDVQARLRLGRLIAGRTLLSDVVADLNLKGGNLTLPLLRFGSGDQWQMELRGDIAGLLRPGAKGRIVGQASAATAQGLEALLALLEVPAELLPSPHRAGLLAPLKLAGRVAVGDKGAEILDIQLDGRLGTSRIAGTMLIEAKGKSWREHGLDAAITIEDGIAAHLLTQLVPARWQPAIAEATAPSTPGRAVLRGIGTAKDGLATFATFDAGGLAAEARGRLTVGETAALELAGDVRLAAEDLGRALAAIGFSARTGLAGVPLSGSVAVAGGDSRWSFDARSLMLGSNRIAGKIEVRMPPAGMQITGRIAAAQASLPFVLAQLTQPPRPPREAALPPGGRRPVWPDGAFDLTPLADVDARVTVEAERIEIAPGLLLPKGTVEIVARNGELELRLAESAALAGKATGTVRLSRAPSGARLTFEAGLTGARLDALAVPGQPAAVTGTLALKLSLEGAGLGPQGLIAGFKGRGELALGGSRVKGLSAGAPRAAAEAVMAIKGEVGPGEVLRQLELALAAGEVGLGDQRLAIEIADGAARLTPVVRDGPEGRVTGTTVVEIESLRFDSEWRLEARSAAEAPARATLPAVAVVYTGTLDRITAPTRQIQLDAFGSEITVRKYERDVEVLEAIRRQDEESARQEAERRRQEEEQRRLEAERRRQELERAPPVAPAEVPAAPPPAPPAASQRQSTALPLAAPGVSPPPGAPAAPAAPVPPAAVPQPLPQPPAAGAPPVSPVPPDDPGALPPTADPQPDPAAPRPPQRPARRDVFKDVGRSAP